MTRTEKAPEECASIEEVRHCVDTLIREIVRRSGARSRSVKAAGRFKASETGVRPDRRKTVPEERRRWAEEEGSSSDAMEKMYRDLIDYSIDRELKDRMRAG
jgi:isochorismate pyruvate lyase